MNWRRGLLRLWTIVSLGWIALSVWALDVPLALSALWKQYPSQEILDEERRTGKKIDSTGKQCVEPPHHMPETFDEELGICTFSPLDDTPPITRDEAMAILKRYPYEAILPPIGLFISGVALGWTVKGFKNERKTN